MRWERIDDLLTEDGLKNIKSGEKGDVLIFEFEGSPIYLKVMRKTKDKVYAQRLDPAKFLSPEEADEQVEVVPKPRT